MTNDCLSNIYHVLIMCGVLERSVLKLTCHLQLMQDKSALKIHSLTTEQKTGEAQINQYE